MYEKFYGRYDIVMFGDSFIQRANWQDMFPDLRVANRGIGGDDTEGMLQRLKGVELTGAKIVFILVGNNDLNRKIKPEQIAMNISKIANYLNEKGMTVIVQSTILSGKENIEKNKLTNELNYILENQRKNYKYLDLNKSLSPNGYLEDKYNLDGTHLTVKGYMVLKSILEKKIYNQYKNVFNKTYQADSTPKCNAKPPILALQTPQTVA